MAKCRARTKNGQRCSADAQSGKEVCVFHDPAKKADGQRARRSGGINRSRPIATLPPETPDNPLRSVEDVRFLLGETINKVRRGELDLGVAKTVGYLLNTLLNAMEQGPPDQPLKNALAFDVYKAKWLRDREARWNKQLEEEAAAQKLGIKGVKVADS